MATRVQSVQDALATYDKQQNEDKVQSAEKDREKMLRRFPLEEWPDMKLEQYAIGQPDSSDTYSYWLEFGTPNMGSMRGGSATKHVIYKHKNKPGWYFRSQYKDEQDAWQALRAGFVEMFELAQSGQWDEISGLEALSGARGLKLKSLFLYYPDEILPITSIDHLHYFLQRLGVYQN